MDNQNEIELAYDSRGRVIVAPGVRVGSWTFISEVEKEARKDSRYREILAECGCGAVEQRQLSSIVKGRKMVSSGCHNCVAVKQHAIPGQKINFWTVIKEVDPDERNQRQALVECACGVQVVRKLSVIFKNDRPSRGCHKCVVSTCKLPGNIAAKRRVFRVYKRNAQTRGLSFNITIDEFETLTQEDCFYCDRNFMQSNTATAVNGETFYYNGLDRVNNNIGYELDNLVSCCFVCNSSKSDKTQLEFFEWIEAVFVKNKSRSENE